MGIDMASVYAERYRKNPDILRAAVIGQSPDRRLDPYTALNALKLVNESNRMMMAGQAQQPTSSPSLVAQNMAPQAGLGAMVPGAMGQMGGQMGQAPQAAPAAPAPTMMAKSGGLASLPTKDFGYAQGGIVAFAKGGANGQERDYTQEVLDSIADDKRREDYGTDQEPGWNQDDSEGSGLAQGDFNAYLMKQLKGMEEYEPKEMSEKEQDALYQKYLGREKTLAGPDIYAPARADLKKRETDIAGNENYGQGLALISAAGHILKGRNLAEGASNAAPAFAQQMAEVKRSSIQEKRSIEQMKFAYADAERKENAGMHRAAVSSMESARKFQQDANKANFDKRRALADLAAKGVQANRPRAGGAGGAKLAERLADAEEAVALNPTPENRARLTALTSAASKMKTTFSTSEVGPEKSRITTAPIQQRVDAKVADSMKSFSTLNPAYRKAVRSGNQAEAKRLWEAEEAKWRGIHSKSEAAAASNTAAPGTAENPIKLSP